MGKAKTLTSAMEDYLRSILDLERRDGRATTSAIAQSLGVTAPSVSEMTKRLATLGFVERLPYRGVVLTEAGRRVALEVLRHHRLLERYLVESLGLPLHGAHAEADRLEHALSEELEARIDEVLGHPTVDPHGDPIPDRMLALAETDPRTLLDVSVGEEVTVARVPDRDASFVLYLTDLSLLPGCTVSLTGLAPFNGPLSVRTDSGEHAIGREVAASIFVA
ncbi:MAG: metal-dependent transcriptional regulator [Actinobacteria bacterium]|nr:MAG: metal-dependent transcriptional regulator [Actinomycetota bacterium]